MASFFTRPLSNLIAQASSRGRGLTILMYFCQHAGFVLRLPPLMATCSRLERGLLTCTFLVAMACAGAAPPIAINQGQASVLEAMSQPSTAADEAVANMLLQAISLLGVTYRFGGSTPHTGLDCSGFIQYVFKKSLNMRLPRTSKEISRLGKPIKRAELQPGDLVFFNTRGFSYSHVGIFLGEDKFIHAPRRGKNVEVASFSRSYWQSHFSGARRIMYKP